MDDHRIGYHKIEKQILSYMWLQSVQNFGLDLEPMCGWQLKT
jgi:hypothetical protein